MLFEEERRCRIEGEERPPSPSQSAEKTTRRDEEDQDATRRRTHRVSTQVKGGRKRTIRGTTIERETFREDHNIGGSRQRFEMPFKVTGLSNHGQSLGSEISANSQMKAKRKPAHKSLWRSKRIK
ncbi:hypothetical protein Tco_0993105 [Tanacetum coccineum]|uniref:Uncharacterized protein n=1 Tax=Tanacetum coccineum TaxID=301880 RepID=A0ABQ5F3Y4_9ASTR